MPTLLLTHPACLDHVTPLGHPERPDRLRAIERILEHERFALLAASYTVPTQTGSSNGVDAQLNGTTYIPGAIVNATKGMSFTPPGDHSTCETSHGVGMKLTCPVSAVRKMTEGDRSNAARPAW